MQDWLPSLLALTVVVSGACDTSSGNEEPSGDQQLSRDEQQNPVTAAANYQLVCDSSDTGDESTLHCMRMDTRNGDVFRVAIDKLPVTQGRTAVGEPSGAGAYQLECHATRTVTTSNLYCVRLDTESGEMTLIGLPKTAVIPE